MIRTRDIYRYGMLSVLMALMLAFLVWPIVLTISGGFFYPESHPEYAGEFTLGYVMAVFEDPLLVEGLVNALIIAVFTTLLCLVLALPLAVLSVRFDFFGKSLLSSLVLVPLILPPFVGAIGLQRLLGRAGSVNALLKDVGILDINEPGIDFLGGGFIGGRLAAVIVMEALHLYPILFLNVTAAMANLDPSLDEAAENLGAGKLRRFFRITLPLILPGIFAGGTIVFIWSFTELGTPLMFDFYTVTPVQIFWGIQEVQASPRPFALTAVMLILAVIMYLLGKLAFGGKSHEMKGKAIATSGTTKLTGPMSFLAAFGFAFVIFIAVLPHIGVIFSSFTVDGTWYRSVLPRQLTLEHYEGALQHPLAMGSIRTSLMLATCAMLAAVVLGLSIAYLNVRAKVKGAGILDTLGMLPLAVPGLVMAFGYVAMSLRWPFNGEWLGMPAPFAGWFDILGPTPNPIPLLIIAYAIRRMPYVLRAAAAGLEQTSGELEEAALNLGAPPLVAVRRIVVPLIMANLIAGGILAFSFAMLEVSDSLILAQKEEHYPITKAIYDMYQRLGDGPYIASAMGVWGMALLTVTLIGAGQLLGKRMGAIFRV